ncbi:MAG: M23 family metallopeptidase [Gammaproteobacteria bacterium]|nr:M23 family metallopeptidase [Gammaproteobacteria bacterium]
MNILLVSKHLGGSACLCLNRSKVIVLATAVLLALPSVALYAGFSMGKQDAMTEYSTLAVSTELERQRDEILEAKRVAEENLNALTLRLGQMQAHVIRLDALGQRLTRIAGLDSDEFDFSNPPAQGGPEEASSLALESDPVAIPDFISQLDELSNQLKDREEQLSVLETMFINRNLDAKVLPTGRPITKGWISSKYGVRKDPFTGKPDWHKGIDLAAREGSDVISVAAGVVTWAGKRYGYGNLVEINHGKGYVTRYGHSKEVLVKVGDTVEKGQVVASVGSTGRSTGPHVHFEVWFNGKTVDPMKYVRASN